jgi:hypothetical protein
MAEETSQPKLEQPPVNSPSAIRELKTLFILVAIFLAMIVISLVIEGTAAWVFEAILLGVCFAAIFRARG